MTLSRGAGENVFFLMKVRSSSESLEMSKASSLRVLLFRSFRLCLLIVCHLAYTRQVWIGGNSNREFLICGSKKERGLPRDEFPADPIGLS